MPYYLRIKTRFTMSEHNDNDISLELKKAKILEQKEKFAREKADVSWKAVAKPEPSVHINIPFINTWTSQKDCAIDFHGKNLENGQFAGENLENANFAGANLRGVNFAGANLRGVDFTGADLTGANLEGADLTETIFTDSTLSKVNFRRVKMKETRFTGADLTDAVFLELDIDNLSLENLQELVEYLAKYYPHKLNLSKFDLTLLNLSQIELANVNLRGVDFTGADFTGVNIMELDLSECIITPEQIAQALGYPPSADELRKILAPKPKKKNKAFFIDLTDFFFDNGLPSGVWFTNIGKSVTFEQIFSAVKRFTNAFKKDEKATSLEDKPKEKVPEDEKSANDELRRIIEENKKITLDNMEEEKKKETPAPQAPEHKSKPQALDSMMIRRGDASRGV